MFLNIKIINYIFLCVALSFLTFKCVKYNNENIRRLSDKEQSFEVKDLCRNYERRLNIKIEKLVPCKMNNVYKCPKLQKDLKKRTSSSPIGVFKKVFPFEYPVIIESTKQCNNGKSLIIGIANTPQYSYSRFIFRKIFADYPYVQYFFFMSKSNNEHTNMLIAEENAIYNDIVQFDINSHFYNISYQLASEYRWLSKHCKNYKYAVYLQEDTYLNITHYEKEFMNSETKAVISQAIPPKEPHREKTSTWYVPYELYPFKKYPTLPRGPCIFFSENTINKIAVATYHMPYVLPNDDAYTSLLLNYSGLANSHYDVSKEVVIYPNKEKGTIKNKLWIHGFLPDLLYYTHLMNKK